SNEGITTLSFFKWGEFFPSALNKTVAAVLPISKAGCVTVVIAGFNITAVCRLVKLTTLIVEGMESFNSLQTIYTGVVSFSTLAIIPSGLTLFFSRSLIISLLLSISLLH